MFEGKTVNLRVIEKEDLPLIAGWSNGREFFGDFWWFPPSARCGEVERMRHGKSQTVETLMNEEVFSFCTIFEK